MSFVKKFSFFLLPSIFQGIIAIVILPITTRILGPAEYGVFALLTSLAGLGTVLSSAGVGYVIAAHYQVIVGDEKKKLVSSALVTGTLIGFLFCVAVLLFWSVITATWDVFSGIPIKTIYLSLIAMMLALPWTLSLDAITLDGRAKLFAMTLILQSVVNAAVVIFSLYALKADLLSLFFGWVAGSAVVCISTCIALWKNITFKSSLKWIHEILKIGFVTVPASLFENVYALAERILLSLHVGIYQLGIFTHSQQYRTIAMMFVKAGDRTVVPITLAEARAEEPNFINTKKTWDIMYIFLALAGMASATIGKYIISLLTNSKFTEAYIFVVFWMIYLLIQNTGKPHTGILIARNQGPSYALMQIVALTVGLVVLFFSVSRIGAYGAVTALFVQMITFRVFIQIKVRALQAIPFQDWWVILGIIFILTTWFIAWYFRFGVVHNLILFLVMAAVFLISARKIVKEAISKLKISITL